MVGSIPRNTPTQRKKLQGAVILRDDAIMTCRPDRTFGAYCTFTYTQYMSHTYTQYIVHIPTHSTQYTNQYTDLHTGTYYGGPKKFAFSDVKLC